MNTTLGTSVLGFAEVDGNGSAVTTNGPHLIVGHQQNETDAAVTCRTSELKVFEAARRRFED